MRFHINIPNSWVSDEGIDELVFCEDLEATLSFERETGYDWRTGIVKAELTIFSKKADGALFLARALDRLMQVTNSAEADRWFDGNVITIGPKESEGDHGKA